MAKAESSPGVYSNAILRQLGPQTVDGFHRHLQAVDLAIRGMIYQPNERMCYAYFVESGMISIVSTMEDGRSIEVGTIGREGMAGASLVVGIELVPYQYYVQIAGNGFRVDANVLNVETQQNAELRNLILRYHNSFTNQSMQAAACNGLHSVMQRCCRWLLMSHDRVQSDRLP